MIKNHLNNCFSVGSKTTADKNATIVSVSTVDLDNALDRNSEVAYNNNEAAYYATPNSTQYSQYDTNSYYSNSFHPFYTNYH